MPKKICTIKLSHHTSIDGETYYRVIQVTDSLSFDPGQVLKTRDVQGLCDSQRWKVTIIKAD
jgi:hypothetical protein